MKIKSILALLLMIVALGAKAERIPTDTVNINGLNYVLFLDESFPEAKVLRTVGVSGELVIPSTVTCDAHEGMVFEVKEIDESAFSGNDAITSVVIGDNIDYIGRGAFYLCSNLASVKLGKKTRVIHHSAFRFTKISTIDIPNSVAYINTWAFQACSELKTVTIGNGVESISSDAFHSCTAVTDVYCYANPTTLEWTVDEDYPCFKNNKETLCHVVDADEWNAKFPDLNLTFVGDLAACVDNNVYYFLDGATAYVGKSFHATGDITILDKITVGGVDYPVTRIIEGAFELNQDITSVVIGNNVTTIEDCAFLACKGMTTVTIPASVTYIGNQAFYNCSAVTDVYCDANPLNLTWMTPDYDFYEWNVMNKTKFHVSDASVWEERFPDARVTFVEPIPDITFYDDQDNNDGIQEYADKVVNVTLSGHKFYKDGCWNTMCLPFDVDIEGSIFEGAEVMGIVSAKFDNGTLTLDFDNLTSGLYRSLPACYPLIVKWANTGEIIESPTFNEVEMLSRWSSPDGTIEPIDIPEGTLDHFDSETGMPVFAPSDITMKGIWGPVTLAKDDKTKLFLGADSKLYYPNEDVTVGAFRAYFTLNNGITAGEVGDVAGAKSITNYVLNFGNETTEIVNIEPDTQNSSVNSLFSDWYTLDGRKLSGIPSAKGIYIHNGRKVMIK